MATKLSSSLRKSVNAEKKDIENKQQATDKAVQAAPARVVKSSDAKIVKTAPVKSAAVSVKAVAVKPNKPTVVTTLKPTAPVKAVSAKPKVAKSSNAAPAKTVTKLTTAKPSSVVKPAKVAAKTTTAPERTNSKLAEPVKTDAVKNKSFLEQSVNSNIFKAIPNLDFNNVANLSKYDINSIQNTIQKASDLNSNLTNCALENLLTVTEDVNNYLRQLSDIRDLANLYKVSLDFYTTLRKRQQELLGKSMQLFRGL